MTETIFHIASRVAWISAQESGAYRADSLASQGFIHCSKMDQVLRVAENVFHGQHGLVLLVIAPARLAAELHWEPGVDLVTELFPHIYGPLNLDAVVDVLDFEPEENGSFSFPGR